ncbi:MAG: nuclear transport factor 2 family protein [Myxococcota bacterium]
MPDRRYTLEEIQDRFAIMDLYDRQLAAAEAFDFEAYDTTFTQDARVDLSDFGQPECAYPAYRSWLASLQGVMVEAQRITGGLRLKLEGDRATTRVPVDCHVTMLIEGERKLTQTGIFYNDLLERREEGWRIIRRVEEKAW